MIDIKTIFDKYQLSIADIDKLNEEAKEVAIDCGKKGITKKLKSKTWDLFDNISDSVWYSDMTIANKIDLGFQFYDTFPSYYHFLVPFYHGIREKEIEGQALKNNIWKKFMMYLGLEQCYSDPIGYVLWVDFFEDQTTVRETWQGLMNYSKDLKALLRLIESAGPVPFDLKDPVYKKLLKDPKNHESIFNSLLFSAIDVNGQFDNRKAGMILSKLKIKTEREDYKLLQDKIRKHGT